MGFLFLGRLGSQASTQIFFNYAKVGYFFGWSFHVSKGKINEFFLDILYIVVSALKSYIRYRREKYQF